MSVTPEQGAEIIRLCQGIQELALHIVADFPDNQNPLCVPLNILRLKMLSLDLASTFYGPMISLPELPILHCIQRLHLVNGWVARRSLYIGLHKLHHLTHISFPVQPPGQQSIHTEILTYILGSFGRLQVVILWHMPYQERRVIYDALKEQGLEDPKVVIFNAAWFAECANDFWNLAELVVQWREDRKGAFVFVLLCTHYHGTQH